MMRVFTSDMKVIDRTRVCVLLVLVFICSIDRSSSVDTAAETEGIVSQINASDRVQSVPISPEGPEIPILIAEVKRRRVSRSVTARNSTTDKKLSFCPPRNLTAGQLNSTVTIEFSGIDRKNRKAVEAAYREVRKKILDYLNRRKYTTASPAHSTTGAPSTTIVVTTTATTSATSPPTTIALPSTTVTAPTTTTSATLTTTTATLTTSMTTTAALTTIPTTSVVETTTEAPTSVATATTAQLPGTVGPKRKRRRRNSGEKDVILTDDDLVLVENDPEFDENGNLRISLFIDEEGVDKDLLYEAIKALKESGELETAAKAPVVTFYRGLPDPLPEKAAMAGFQVWLPILLAIILLLIIFILVFCCWMAKNKKVKDANHKKIIPPLDSKPSPSNGNAPKPRILTDSDEYLVPMDQFNDEY